MTAVMGAQMVRRRVAGQGVARARAAGQTRKRMTSQQQQQHPAAVLRVPQLRCRPPAGNAGLLAARGGRCLARLTRCVALRVAAAVAVGGTGSN